MKLFSIALGADCPCQEELSSHIYDIGHNIYKLSKGAASPLINEKSSSLTEFIDYIFKRFTVDTINFSENKSIYISITKDANSEQYTVATIINNQGKLQIICKANIQGEYTLNGADIYQEIVSELEECISMTIILLAQGIIISDETLSDSILKLPQLDLDKLRSWHKSNDTFKGNISYEKDLYAAFEYTSTRVPTKTAIKFNNQSITYNELKVKVENYSNRLVEKLDVIDSDRQPTIAVALPKSIELYAVILAILKIDGCYIPIDPEYPEDRIRNILEKSAPDILIGCSLQTSNTIKHYCLEELETEGTRTWQRSGIPVSGKSRATTIYTSGSTGTPKGVQLTHENISHFINWYCNETNLTNNSKCLQFTTVSFDASLLDIFPALITGSTLVVPTQEQRHDFSKLDELVQAEQVTHCFIPPAMLSALPKYEWSTMEYIVTGGDVCDSATIDHWSQQCNLVNIYGPTECTVLATSKRFDPKCNNKIIGKPIQNTKIYLVNEFGHPCQTLEQGELYISGPGVGPGYVNDEKQTNERFVQMNTLASCCKMYRTGDICFWDSNGEINFVGRKDNQVKIRGFRVELGEIENSILRLNMYSGCIVVSDDKRQVRAFVKGPEPKASIESLRMKLEAFLPNYMMPTYIIEVDDFPYTENGKVDRRKLIEFKIKNTSSDVSEVWVELQSELRKIWAEILDITEEEISLKSSFFDLGGHSLLVSKMLLVVKNTYVGNFTLARFMENPTIDALSNLLTEQDMTKGAQISDHIYADMVLQHNIRPLSDENPFAFRPRNVLLTGATGFLGAHILEQLINKTEATVYCLIRASSRDHAFNKLSDSSKKFGIKSLNNNPKIKVICGNLAESRLGINNEDYEFLKNEIDVIYHNGAQVNHIYDYKYLFNENVRSTIDLLQLACTSIQKQMVFISTLSAASNIDESGRIVEDGPAGQLPAFVNNGYNLTKWVSEQLVWQAHERGLPVTLVRPGNICGHSKTGHCFPDQNRILLLLKGAAQMGVAPDWDIQFDLCPVDFIAEGVVEGTLDKLKHVSVLHFHNPKPLSWKEYVGRLQHHGIEIEFIPDTEWRKNLLTLDPSNALYQVVSFYLDDKNEDIGDISNIEYSQTMNRLQLSGIDYPEKDQKLVDANLGFLISSGFIQKNEVERVVNY
ncbi:amino acid adenylation domain-containing protein [Serratia sp. DD3]|uniref:amino acid adenylation domain-containing protein n=1 Tax=Serratia sp. DD3 TaxID=1410619 RepID=UPI0004D915AA|nr:amino acid adenylation domain-containing protein [Serratia sp. DD3]KEY57001.1 linear gramicidin synthase subunit D [Serratia sp. DD3]